MSRKNQIYSRYASGRPNKYQCDVPGCTSQFSLASAVGQHKWNHLPAQFAFICPGLDKGGDPCQYTEGSRREWPTGTGTTEPFKWPTLTEICNRNRITIGGRWSSVRVEPLQPYKRSLENSILAITESSSYAASHATSDAQYDSPTTQYGSSNSGTPLSGSETMSPMTLNDLSPYGDEDFEALVRHYGMDRSDEIAQSPNLGCLDLSILRSLEASNAQAPISTGSALGYNSLTDQSQLAELDPFMELLHPAVQYPNIAEQQADEGLQLPTYSFF